MAKHIWPGARVKRRDTGLEGYVLQSSPNLVLLLLDDGAKSWSEIEPLEVELSDVDREVVDRINLILSSPEWSVSMFEDIREILDQFGVESIAGAPQHPRH